MVNKSKKEFSEKIDKLLAKKAEELEPKTHCCNCTKGEYYEPQHFVHIQMPNCKCDPKKYVLKKN